VIELQQSLNEAADELDRIFEERNRLSQSLKAEQAKCAHIGTNLLGEALRLKSEQNQLKVFVVDHFHAFSEEMNLLKTALQALEI